MTRAETATRANLWPAAAPFVVIGTASIIAGGLISGVMAHAPTRHGAWLVAYLILVVGVAQIALGIGQAWLAGCALRGRVLGIEFIAFNLGNAAVVLGTLFVLPLLVGVGGAALIVALVFFYLGVRGGGVSGWPRYVYWFVITVLVVSIPIGLVLARVLS